MEWYTGGSVDKNGIIRDDENNQEIILTPEDQAFLSSDLTALTWEEFLENDLVSISTQLENLSDYSPDSHIKLSWMPEIYGEFEIVYEDTNGDELDDQFGLRPVIFTYRKSGTENSPENKKNVLVEIFIKSRDNTGNKSSNLILSNLFELGFIEPGSKLKKDDLVQHVGEMFLLPQPKISTVNGQAKMVENVPVLVTMIVT